MHRDFLALCSKFLLIVAFLCVNPVSVAAQSSNATCVSDWLWTINSRRQTPCLVAAYLIAPCAGGQWAVPALENNEYYQPPPAQAANQCLCSSVVYQLMSACGSCQSQQIVQWSTWRQNCPSSLVTVSSYPLQIPSGTAAPAWAYLNVTYLDRFDAAAAQAVLTEPDVTSDASSTPTSSSSSDPTTTPTSTTSNTATPSASETSPVPDSPSDKNNIPAIVGGTVGGVVGLGLIACLVLYIMKRDSRKVPASAEFSKVIPPGSPVPASFDPAVVGFRSHTTSPVNHGLLNNAGGPYVIPNQPHQHQNSVPVAPYAAPWSPPPATYTPAPNAGYYSNIHTPNINQQLNYTPLPGHTGSPPPMQQYSHSHSASMGHTPSPYQGMPPYGPGASGNPSFATGTPEI